MDVAQQEERRVANAKAVGSIPIIHSKAECLRDYNTFDPKNRITRGHGNFVGQLFDRMLVWLHLLNVSPHETLSVVF